MKTHGGFDFSVQRRSRWARLLVASAVLLVGTTAWAQTYGVSTYAGLALQAASSDTATGPATAARFNTPKGVAVDTAGNVYVADAVNGSVRKIAAVTGITTTIGTGFISPAGVAVDGSGVVYVADTGHHRIAKIVGAVITVIAGDAAAGTFGLVDSATKTTARFWNPSGIAVNAAGSVAYVADTTNNVIRKIDITGATGVTTIAGTVTLGSGVAGLVNASPGTAASFTSPYAVALNAAGTLLFVADRGNHSIRQVALTSSNAVTTFAGTSGTFGSADSPTPLFKNPEGIAIDAGGVLYVSDSGNATVRMITSAGLVSTIAGTAGLSGTGDGLSTAARFQEPFGVAVHSSGNIFVADAASQTIRRLAVALAPGVTLPLSAPLGNTVMAGGTISYATTISGSPAATIQWQVQPAAGGGFTPVTLVSPYSVTTTAFTSTLTITGATTALSGNQYRVVAVNGVAPDATSAAVTLTVNQPFTITSADNTMFVVNTAGAFQVTATGLPAPTFSITAGSSPAAIGVTLSPTGLLSGTPLTTAGSPLVFTITATNAVGSVSQSFTLYVSLTPVITAVSAPRQVVTVGQNLTLSVTATGATLYQWKRNGLSIAGATGANYAITGADSLRDNGWYQVVATNSNGSVTSAVMFVQVQAARSQVVGWGYNGYGQTTIPSGISSAVAIAAGENHSLGLTPAGTVVAWGSGGSGQTTVPSGLSGVVAVAARSAHSLALKSDGTVVAWGSNSYGQTTIPSGLIGVVAIAAGYNHNLALKADGAVVAWGSNASGATQVPADLASVVAVTAGNQFSLALKFDGAVVGWGSNSSGQTTIPYGLDGVVAVAAGYTHSLALKSDGTVVAWGDYGYGQTTISSGLNGVVAVCAGQYHSLALKSDGTVVAWGSNSNGATTIPTGLNHVRAVVAGGTFNLVLRESAGDLAPIITTSPASQAAFAGQNVTLNVGVNVGTGYATTYQWRKAGSAITGATTPSLSLPRIASADAASYDVVVTNWLGTATSAAATVTVNTAAGVSMNLSGQQVLAVGQSLTLSATTLLAAPVTYQWRRNGQPITGSTSNSYTLANATVRSAGVYQVVVTNSAGPLFGPSVFVSVNAATQVRAWGSNSAGQSTVPVGLTNAMAVAAGSAHTLALRADGTLVSWGDNTSGQATIPSGLSGVAAIAASGNYSMALRADGTVVTWGGNINYTPAGLSNVIAIAAGSGAMALRADGTVVVWDGTSVRTDTPAGLDGVVSIAAGSGGHYLAAKADGSVVVWGDNNYGQMNVPAGLGGVMAVTAGVLNCVALKSDGTIVAWGTPPYWANNGQNDVPAGLGSVISVGTGDYHSVALKSDGTVVAWGFNNQGQTTVPTGLGNVFSLACGSEHVLALRDTSTDAAPTITSQPVASSALKGTSATFAVTATGTTPFTHQWSKGGVAIADATNATFTISSVQPTDAGNYTVTVTNGAGSTTSNVAALTVPVTPTFTSDPAARSVLALGGSVTLTATATGATSYQWKHNGQPIAGATGATFAIVNADPLRDGGWYQLVASNGTGPTNSAVAFVSVSVPGRLIGWGRNDLGQTTVPSGLGNVIAVAAGQSHGLALKADGTVSAWGSGGSGQTPVPSGLSGVVAVAAGHYHNLALKSDGTVVAWGDSSYSATTIPSGLSGVVAVGAGYYDSVALKSDGTLVAWGRNYEGQTTIPSGLNGVVAVAAGYTHSLALKSDGTVVAWGSNDYSQTTIPSGLSGVVAVAAGYFHSLALKSDGTVLAWGRNYEGQTTIPSGLSEVVAVAAGQYHSLALKSDGTVVAWGNNGSGQATAPNGLTGVFAVAGGGEFSLALYDSRGDLAPTNSAQPRSESANRGKIVALSVGVSTGTTPGTTFQWRKAGQSIAGATNAQYTIAGIVEADAGNYDVVVTNYLGSVTSNTAVVSVNASPVVNADNSGRYLLPVGQTLTLTLDPAISTSAVVQWRRNGQPISSATGRSQTVSGAGYYQALYQVGTQTVLSAPIFVHEQLTRSQVVGWGNNDYDRSTPPVGLSGVVAVAAGSFHSLALKSDGAVVAWGYNGWGRTTVPTGLSSVVAVAAGESHSLALNSDGTVVAWGYNPNGQTTIPSGLTGVVAIAAGYYHNLALRSDGTVEAWGNNASGAAQIPTDLVSVVAIAAGNQFSLALKSDGIVVGWGSNSSGQTTIPSGLNGVVAVAAGSSHSLALKADGTVVAWGNNGNSQTTVPSGLSGIVAIAAGQNHSLAQESGGRVVAWGSNSSGATTIPSGLNLVHAIGAGASYNLILRESAGDTAPVIATQPAAQTAFVGQNVTLNVGVNFGTGYATTYQWRKAGSAIASATTASLSLPRITPSDAGSYDVIATNWLGTATSTAATVAVNPNAGVAMNLTGQLVLAVGQSLTFSATTLLAGPVTYQWRRNGQPIAGATSNSYTLANATVRSAGAYQVVVTNSAGALFGPAVFVGVNAATQVRAWGNNASGQITIPNGLTSVMALAAGSGHTLVLNSDGTLRAWGDNSSGQATIPSGLSGVAAIAASGNYNLALRADGTVATWGGSINYTPAGLNNVIAIAAGSGAMALRADGTVVVWDSASVRTDIPIGLDGAVSIAASSGAHYLAARADGSVVAWGSNGNGQATVPSGLGGVVAVAAGESFSLALKSDGTVIAWGYNGSGQTTVSSGLAGVMAIAAGQNHSLALESDGTVAAWGNNGYGLTTVPSGLGNVFAIASGSSHVLALRDTSTDVAPTITTQPANATALAGQTVSLTVVATGTVPLAYQWRKDGTSIAVATNATLTFNNVQTTNAGSYDVVVSNGVGSVTSAAATVAVSPPVAPAIVTQPATQAVGFGAAATFSVTASGTTPLSYQWRKNGANLSGATSASYTIPSVQATDVGSFDVVVYNSTGSVTSAAALLLLNPAELARLSVQVAVPSTGVSALFTITGAASKSVLIRAAGPALLPFGIGSALVDPQLSVINAVTGAVAGSNDDWGGASELTEAFARFGLFAFASGSKDSAVLATLPPGTYTVQLAGAGSTTGIAILELYDADTTRQSAVTYLAFKGPVAAGGNLVVGLGLGGTNTGTVLVRAAGPALGVAGSLTDPFLSVNRPSGLVLASNDNWVGTAILSAATTRAGAFPFVASSKDSALPLTLAPGAYYAQVSGSGGVGGTVLVEFHDISTGGDRVPFVITPPMPQVAVVGGATSFSVVAAGTDPLTYQWRKDGAAIAGATGASLALSAIQAGDAGAYDVLVSNPAGSTLSAAATLVVTAPIAPAITTPPAGAALTAGNSMILSVTASGSTPLSYQWRKDSADIAGATNASFALNNVQLGTAGAFDVVVSNMAGSATSSTAVITVSPGLPPIITVQPVSQSVPLGSVVGFTVTASGTPPLTYQWRRNGSPYPGAVTASHVMNNLQISDAGSYDVVVTNGAGTITSSAAVLSLTPAVWFTAHPISRSLFVGTAVTLTSSAVGYATPTYQWRKDGVAITGAIGSSLILGVVQVSSAGIYDVVATTSVASATSNPATVTVTDSVPVITQQPAGATLAVGGAVTLSVTAGGSQPLTYQWRRSGLTLSGATTSSLLISNAQTYNTGDYEVIVANALGIATSTIARINVIPRVVAYSARLVIGQEGAVAVFTVEGTASKTLLLRAVGPGLAPFGITGLIADPQLEVFNSTGLLLAVNNDWGTAENAAALSSTTAAVGAFALSVGSRDSAVLRSFAPGTYTVRASAASGAAGVGYLELYDADLATGPISTIPFVAVRGRVAPGSGVVIGGMGSNGRGQRSYLIRALGPMLGLPTAVSDPSFLVVRDNAFVGMNDNWDAVSLEAGESVAAATRLGLAPLTTGSKDAALVLAGNLHAGSHTVQVSSPEGTSGLVLLELHDLDAARPAVFAPVMASSPGAVTADSGSPFTLRALAYGTPPLTYQWIKDEVPVVGATAATYTVAVAAAAHVGSYKLIATNAQGTATSLSAGVELQNAPLATVQPASQAVTPGSSATFTVAATNPSGGPLTYQWYFTPVGGSTSQALSDAVGKLTGAGTASLMVGNAQTADAGAYFCVVANGVAPATSNAAQLTVATRIVQIVSLSASIGANAVVAVELLATGSENAVGFTLYFNPAQLTYVSAALGAQAADATLNANSTQLASGKLGLALAKPAGVRWTAGTQEIVTLTFTVNASLAAGTVAPLTFGDSPVLREISDAAAQALPGGYQGGTITLASGFEADMNGNGAVSITDWVKVGRIVAGLDVVANGSDFQKADCAGRTTLGNGVLSISDWVQAGRYAAGLDPLTPAGGPTAPIP